MWRLLFPLRYFSLHNREKSRIDLWPTLWLSVLLSFPYWFFHQANYFFSGGFLDKIIPLSSALTAFYVAALVAVATFSHPDLDKIITIGEIYFIEKDHRGNTTKDRLTRRQFACIIFGYLAFIAMVISVAAAMAVTVSGVSVSDFDLSIAGKSLSVPTAAAINASLTVIFNLAVAHMMVVTALGLYYLIERIHDREPRIITKKSGSGTGT